MLLSTKNLKQKRFNKKLLHKLIKLFRIEDKINEQAYRLILLNIYLIHNIFSISFLKLYLHRANDLKARVMMQVSKLIND